MKNLLLLLLFFAACSKPDVKIERLKTHELIWEDNPPTYEQFLKHQEYTVSDARGGVKGPNKPKPTPDPEPEQPTIGTVLLYVDADGHVNNEPEWTQTNNYQPIISPASLMTTDAIQIAVDTLKDHFKEFRVIITTDESTYLAFQFEKTRIVFTPRHWSTERPNVSGLAYPFSLRAGTGSTVYVFTSVLYELGQWAGKIASHEAGHSFGLHHQRDYDEYGNTINTYKEGCTMGQCYNQGCFWVIGQYSWGYWQDDRAIIAGRAGYR